MTKADLVEAVQRETPVSRRQAQDLVDLFFNTIKRELVRCGRVKLSRFGNFEVRSKKSRAGRNPQTGEPICIGARNVLAFKPSRLLRAALDAKIATEQMPA